MSEENIDVYTDISIGPRCIGVGIVIRGYNPDDIRYGTRLPANLSPAEAETAALLDAVRLVSALVARKNGGEIRFHTDCETTIRAMFDLGRVRSQVLKNLIKGILKETKELNTQTNATVCVRYTMSRSNPAHDLSREARKSWTDLLNCKRKDS